ncbi:MAG: HlyD family efflux transporter periplasmic adaptor subunit [Planctomycetaceae bacterium]
MKRLHPLISANRLFAPLPHRVSVVLSAVAASSVVLLALTGAVEQRSAPVDVGLTEIQPSLFRVEVERSGIIEAIQCNEVKSECYWTTPILSIVPEGTWVQAGDVVCVLDSSEIEEYAKAREAILIRFRSRLDNALHEETMQATNNERALSAAEFKYRSAEQELNEYQNGTLPQQIADMQQNLSMLSQQTEAAADVVRHTERLWSMGMVNAQSMSKDSVALLTLQQKHDQMESKLRLLTEFNSPRNSLRLEHTRTNALRNVARTKLANSLAVTKARLTSLAYERTVRIYEHIHKRAIDSIDACTLRAPCDGQVLYGNSWRLRSYGITQIEEGAKVRQSQKVFEIPDTRRLKVSVPIDEALIYRVSQGMPVTVRPKGYDDVEVAGRILNVARYPVARSRYTPSVKDYWLDIELLPTEDQSSLLTLRADVDVRLTIAENAQALQIPRSAIAGIAGHNFVYVFDGRELVPRRIQLGEANTETVCVTAGLEVGEHLVTEMTPQHRQQLEDTVARGLDIAAMERSTLTELRR